MLDNFDAGIMAMNQIKLEVTDAQLVPLSRENDRYLMDDFQQLHIFDDAELSDINICRIFLQVTTLSDITDGSGLESQRRHSKGNVCQIEGQHYAGPNNRLL